MVLDGWPEVCEKVNSSFSRNNLELQQQGNNKFSEVENLLLYREHMVFYAHRCVYEWSDERRKQSHLFPNSLRMYLFIISTFGFDDLNISVKMVFQLSLAVIFHSMYF